MLWVGAWGSQSALGWASLSALGAARGALVGGSLVVGGAEADLSALLPVTTPSSLTMLGCWAYMARRACVGRAWQWPC